ncbi:hypothetical protein LSTR_LSTR015374 [Laodelphax striatellus]|uniref:Uncharacterized protein n=1 Tax=Laodelphax striatellus TaxID=195883 RepID=A0A482XBZ2_LAOST|nr:hypothetical protein LSTR_LSTR015374 [Laodelphax striatellus]
MCPMRLTLIAAKNRNIWVSQTPPVRSGVNQVIDITISDVEDNCLAAMGRNCSRLTPSYTAHLLFGEQHSPLLDEIISAFDSLEESVSDEGVAISVTLVQATNQPRCQARGKGRKVKGKAKSCSLRAGLQFRVGCIHPLLCKGNYAERVGAGCSRLSGSSYGVPGR